MFVTWLHIFWKMQCGDFNEVCQWNEKKYMYNEHTNDNQTKASKHK